MSKSKDTTAYRSAVSGRFVTQRQAERNPRETVKERISSPPKKSK